MKRFVLVFALLLLAVAPLSLQGQEMNEVNFGISQNVDTLDVNLTTFSGVVNIMSHVFDPLVWQYPLGTFHPGLATEWSINSNATEYTFQLRDDVTFHDGTPLTAEAVKFTFDRILDPENNAQSALSLLGPFEEAVVVDDHTVTIRFSSPYAPFLNSVSSPLLGITSPTAVAELGEDYGLTKVVGSGAYMVESYVPESSVVLVKNPNWTWGPESVFGTSGPAHFDQINYTIVREPSSRLAALESGQMHFINDVPTPDVPRLEEDERLSILRIEQPGHGWSLMFNFYRNISNELAVRQAIAHAIDKQAVVDIVFNGLGTPACSPLTKVMFAYIDVQCADYPYDPEKAEAILDEAGWVDSDGDGIRDRDGKPLWLEHWTISTVPAFAGMSTVIQSYLADVGIHFNLNLVTAAGYFDAVRAGEHHTQHWWDTGLDPDTISRTLFHSSNADGGTNRNRYRNHEMDALIHAGSSAAVTEEREAIYHQLQQKVADEVIMVFMVDPFLLYGADARLQGMTYLAGGNISNFIAASFSDE